MFLNILVAVDGSASSKRALDEAIDLARAMNSLLTLVTVAPPVSGSVAFAGLSAEAIREESDAWAERILRDAAVAVPAGVIAHRVQLRGDPGHEIVAELRRRPYDLVVVGTRGRGRAQEGLLGSVNGYLHFHADVPILSCPSLEEA
jgi:nucleotide-binding universal stress UspA family protein